jgi:integrase
MPWIESRGKQFRVYQGTTILDPATGKALRNQVTGKVMRSTSFEPFATREKAAQFAQLIKLMGWDQACIFVNKPKTIPKPVPVQEPGAIAPITSIPPFAQMRPSGVTVATLCNLHIAGLTGQTEKTLVQYRSYVATHIEPFFGSTDAGFVLSAPHPKAAGSNVKTIAEWTAALAKKSVQTQKGAHETRTLTPKTIRNIHGFLSSVYNQALAAEFEPLVDRNPCRGIAKNERKTKEQVFLTPDEFTALYSAMHPHYQPFLLALVITGLRWSEAAGLQVKNVHLNSTKKRPYLEVFTTLQRVNGGGTVIANELKTASSKRSIGLTPELAAQLSNLIKGKGPDEPVFTTVTGSRLHHSNFVNQYLLPAITKCEDEVQSGTRPHSLRHTCASWLLEGDRSMYQVSQQLGHASPATTATYYAHMQPSVREENAEALTEFETSILKPKAVVLKPAAKAVTLAPALGKIIPMKPRKRAI